MRPPRRVVFSISDSLAQAAEKNSYSCVSLACVLKLRFGPPICESFLIGQGFALGAAEGALFVT